MVSNVSFHSGERVFFLVSDLKTFDPLRENTAYGSDLPIDNRSAAGPDHECHVKLTASVGSTEVVSFQKLDAKNTLV